MIGGLSALSLDALSSVAYGPEAMMLVLVAAGTGALSATLPLTLVITGMLVLLVLSYGQVIAAHPDGGGAYAVAKQDLGRRVSLLAAAALFVDYVLTVADLTAASLFYPLVRPPEAPAVVDAMPEPFERFRATLEGRPGYAWVRETFRRHRRARAPVAADAHEQGAVGAISRA